MGGRREFDIIQVVASPSPSSKAHQLAPHNSVSGTLSLVWWAVSFYLVFHHLHKHRLRIPNRVQSVVPCDPQILEQQLGS
jgi:hypothetical protein